MKNHLLRSLFITVIIALFPLMIFAKDHPSIPSPPKGGSGVVTVSDKIYTAKGKYAGYVHIDYIFRNGALQGVKHRLVDQAGMPYKVEPMPPLIELKKK